MRATWVLSGPGTPDLGAIDDIARLALGARRRGERLLLHDVSPEMDELVHLSGLPVEVERQPEGREEAFRVEEV